MWNPFRKKQKDPDPIIKDLDAKCYNCNGFGSVHGEDCDVCEGTGYQLTRNGVELMNFVVRHRLRIYKYARRWA